MEDKYKLYHGDCINSGTIAIACLNTNRRFIGIELDEKYFKISKDRIENRLKEINNK